MKEFKTEQLTLGEVHTLSETLGGAKVVKKILEGRVKCVLEDILLHRPNQITVLNQKECHNPKKFFKNKDEDDGMLDIYVWNFNYSKELVLRFTKPLSNIPAVTMDRFRLNHNAKDKEIMSKLPEGYLFTNPSLLCAYIAWLIKEQFEKSENDCSLNKAHQNLFYLEVNGEIVVISVKHSDEWRFRDDPFLTVRSVHYQEWYIGFDPVNGENGVDGDNSFEWPADSYVFSAIDS